MIDVALLPLYLTAVVALLLIPGPDMLLITSASLNYGKRVGVWASLGNATSGLVLTLLAATGVSAVIAQYPLALEGLRYVGALYLMKMGWDCLRTKPSNDAVALSAQKNLGKALYRQAVVSNLFNPKALLFFVLFLPQFVSTDISTSSAIQLLSLGVLLNVMGLLFNLSLVAFVGQLGKKLLQGTSFRAHQHKCMGVIFILLSVWLIASQIPG